MSYPAKLCAIALSAALLQSCGGGGSGGGGSGTATIEGTVTSLSTASRRAEPSSWLARLRNAWGGYVREVFAQASFGGIDVIARRGGRSAAASTDGSGAFRIPNAPTGRVEIVFDPPGDCEASDTLVDVVDESTITLDGVEVECDSVRASVAETFQGVIRNKPRSPNGNLTVCVNTGSATRNRVVKIRDAVLLGPGGEAVTFDDLAVGDGIEASGEREGLGAPSALDADVVQTFGPAGGSCIVEAPPPVSPEEPTSAG